MGFYCVIVSYRDDQEFVALAESTSLAEMKRLAELVCRHATSDISWVKIEDDDGYLEFYWSAATYGDKDRAFLNDLPVNEYIN